MKYSGFFLALFFLIFASPSMSEELREQWVKAKEGANKILDGKLAKHVTFKKKLGPNLDKLIEKRGNIGRGLDEIEKSGFIRLIKAKKIRKAFEKHLEKEHNTNDWEFLVALHSGEVKKNPKEYYDEFIGSDAAKQANLSGPVKEPWDECNNKKEWDKCATNSNIGELKADVTTNVMDPWARFKAEYIETYLNESKIKKSILSTIKNYKRSLSKLPNDEKGEEAQGILMRALNDIEDRVKDNRLLW